MSQSNENGQLSARVLFLGRKNGENGEIFHLSFDIFHLPFVWKNCRLVSGLVRRARDKSPFQTEGGFKWPHENCQMTNGK